MEAQFRRMQRATVARSALDVIALIFLGCGFAFWGVAFWQLLAPPQLASLLTIQAAVLAMVYSLAAPLLLSMLIPTTPAGQLLQKTQWRTIGFPVIIACAFFLTFQAFSMIELWLYAQPGVAEAGFARPLAISLTIAFVVIPALAWIQLTPERWLQQIQQAHAVRKLEIQQSGELAIIKTRMVWAKQKAAIDYANLLPLEQKEVLDTMRALFMSIGDTQRSIAGTLGISADIEREMMDDTAIADHLDRVANALTANSVKLPEIAPQEIAPAPPAPPVVRMRDLAPQEAARVIDQAFDAHVDSRSQSRESPPVSDATRRQATPGDAAYLRAARDAFGRRPWTLKQLAAELKIGDTSAGDLRDRWTADGSARQVNLGRWSFDTQ